VIRTIAVIGTLVLLLPSFMQAAADDNCWNGTITQQDGITYVHNASESNCPPVVYEMVERWRLPCDGAEDFVFGAIVDAKLHPSGVLCLLDNSTQVVHKVSTSSGKYVGTIGRGGEGPGEFLFPTGLVLFDDGAIGVVDASSSKIVLLSIDNISMGSWRPNVDGFDRLDLLKAWPTPSGLLVCLELHEWGADGAADHVAACLFRANGELLAELARTTSTRPQASVMVYDEEVADPTLVLGVISNGVAVLSRCFGEYELSFYGTTGVLESVSHRDYEPWKRTPEDQGMLTEYWTALYSNYQDVDVRISEYERTLYSVHERAGQELWVEHSRGWFDNEKDAALSYDIYDLQGRFQSSAVLKGTLDPVSDSAFLVGEGVLVVREGSDLTVAAVGGRHENVSTDSAGPAIIYYELERQLNLDASPDH